MCPKNCLPLAIAVVALAAVAPRATAQDPVLTGCELKFVDDIQLPATEAGVLLQLGVKEGAFVREGQAIGRIDDREAQMQLKVAEQQMKAALAKYHDKIEEQYARAAADAAEAEVAELREANSGRVGNVVTKSEMRRAELEHTRALLQIDKALKDRQLASYDYFTRKAEYEAALQAIERRIITAPFTGEVIQLHRKQAEWVNPGDPILQFVRFDVLKVEGRVALDQYDPRDIDGCEVTVEVTGGRNEKRTVKGRITHVEQEVQFEGNYVFPVAAEIANQEVDGRWVFIPGQRATMTIHLNTRTPNVSRRDR